MGALLLLQVYRTRYSELIAIYHQNIKTRLLAHQPGHFGSLVQIRDCSTGSRNTFPPPAQISPNQPACPEIWLIFAGLGSQWTGMCESLMQLGTFSDSMRKSREILEGVGVDLSMISKRDNRAMFESITAASVSTGVILVSAGSFGKMFVF